MQDAIKPSTVWKKVNNKHVRRKVERHWWNSGIRAEEDHLNEAMLGSLGPPQYWTKRFLPSHWEGDQHAKEAGLRE